MKHVFAVLAALFYLGGFGGCMLARTAISEIAALVAILTGTLFFVGAGILEALNQVRDRLPKPPK